MAIERMGLKEAGALLGLTRNAVKARIAAGKLQGAPDNLGKWWVMIDPETAANDRPRHVNDSETAASNDTSNDTEKSGEIAALTGHIATLKAALAASQADAAVWREKAEAAALVSARLEASLAALTAKDQARAGEVTELRRMLAEANDERRQLAADYLAKMAALAPTPRRGWLERLSAMFTSPKA